MLLTAMVFSTSLGFTALQSAAAAPSPSKTSSTLVGYTVDNNWNNLGPNTVKVSVVSSTDSSETFSFIIETISGKKYAFSATGNLLRNGIFGGSGTINVDGQPEIVEFTINRDLNRLAATIGQDLQFQDGIEAPSYSQGLAAFKELQSKIQSATASTNHSSISPNTVPVGGGSVDPNSLSDGPQYNGVNGIDGTDIEVVGNPTLQRSPQVQQPWQFRSWLGDTYWNNVDCWSVQAAYSVNFNDPDVTAVELFPNPPQYSSFTDTIQLSYEDFSLTWSQTVSSANYTNQGSNFTFNLAVPNWGYNQMIYNGEDNGNGGVIEALVESSYGAQVGWHYNGSATTQIEIYSSDTWTFSWTTPVTASFIYDVT